MLQHEFEALDQRLKDDLDRFLARHDVPRSDARPLHDKYTAVYGIKELTM